ncbi:MAG: peptidoglycan-binding protein [bacterium]
MQFQFWKKIILVSILFIFLTAPFIAESSVLRFNVDPSYDYLGRSQIKAFLHQLGEKAYFYVEDDYYQALTFGEKETFGEALKILSKEFDERIYPQLTEVFGSEWTPGIDGDERITILLSRIKADSGGYFNSGDEYPQAQVVSSNEREMLYLNVNYIGDPLVKSYLAHEFIHLITFNQKNKKYGSEEEIWLNEGRAEYAPTLLGYDQDYQNSNLKKRVRTFSGNPSDPLTEWRNQAADYGVLNVFTQYLVDHYGVEILTDSLQSEKTGISSLNYALKKNKYSEDFSEIFTDWTIAVLLNDCQISEKYCYFNQNLKSLRVLPQLNYLPLAGESTLKVTDYTKDWTGNWIKFIGGQGKLELEFVGNSEVNFKVPYLAQSSSGEYSVSFFSLDDSKRGTIYVANFGEKYNSLIIAPSVQEKISGFDGLEPYRQFIWSASVIGENSNIEEELINELLAKIEYLKAEIAKVQAKIAAILGQQPANGEEAVCSRLENNLYYGIANNQEVRCLQQFLKDQGADIYPQGLITGNFLSLTQQAVIRFQEKYRDEILTPLGLQQGTGFVGFSTRAKMNQLLVKSRRDLD